MIAKKQASRPSKHWLRQYLEMFARGGDGEGIVAAQTNARRNLGQAVGFVKKNRN
jgi:hypothetical protein